MNKLTYRVELHISPVGVCKATLREYPDYMLIGCDFNDLMHKVQNELPEFLYMMSCSPRSFVSPIESVPNEKSIIGVMIYYIQVKVHGLVGGTHRYELRMHQNQWQQIDHILEHHDYFKSRGHFITWATMKAADSLTSSFWDDLNDFTNGSFDPSLPMPNGCGDSNHPTSTELLSLPTET